MRKDRFSYFAGCPKLQEWTAGTAAPSFRSLIPTKPEYADRPGWLGFLDTFRTLCIDPEEEIQSTFEAMRNSWTTL
jgi:hypothetical protein